ncbi:MAG: twin-arginine translocase TatA/TatE family subunit [SAR324 cluster bacterium]|nr:twin-arginine translocase TatA/TatE family subunit [SAR324 cluster bacterium]
MFGIGLSELLVIGLLMIFFYGPTKMPEVARTIAKLLVQSKRFVNDLRYNVKEDIEKIGGKELKALQSLKTDLEKKVSSSLGSRDLPQILNKAADMIDADASGIAKIAKRKNNYSPSSKKVTSKTAPRQATTGKVKAKSKPKVINKSAKASKKSYLTKDKQP